MKDSMRNIFLLSMILFLVSGCQKPKQETETAAQDSEPGPVLIETEEPSPEPTPFDMSAIKWIVLGDSITEKNAAAEISYYDFVQKDFQCEVVNYGRSSTGYKVPATYEPFYDRIEQIDFSDADVITIFGSFNDLGQGYEVGTAEDEGTETLGGCMNRTIENIRDKAPDIKIGIATPTPWNLGEGYNSVTDSVLYWGVSKEECDQYVALLMEVAKKQNVPVLDLYHAGLFDPNYDVDRAQYFNENGRQDHGVHPNSIGHSLMAPLWKAFLLELLGQTESPLNNVSS
ncbi:MAG: SGNH/GDSL hydrolase family protein [Solobacterium sp.]|nr:SGNH/GDSL hydrolase family protein [Solobacterium sp.]